MIPTMKKILLLSVFCSLMHLAWGAVVEGKTYRLVSVGAKDKSLFIENSSLQNNANILLWTDMNVPSQQWEAVRNSDGSFAFKNVYSGKFLTRRGVLGKTSQLYQTTLSNFSSSKWKVEAVAGQAGQYQLVQQDGGQSYCITTGSTNDGAALSVDVIQKNQTGGADPSQIWQLVEVEPINKITRALRDEVMNGWTKQFVKPRGANVSFGIGGGWGDAEMLETMLDAYETSGQEAYLDLFKKGFNYFKSKVKDNWLRRYWFGYRWHGHDFNDDVMWMIIASARAGLLTGSTTYTQLAKDNFDAIYQRAYNPWGMLRWAERTGDRNGTNSCINGPAEVAACYIAMATGDETYYVKARDLYAKQRRYLFNASTGQVYDSFIWDATTNLPSKYNRWASTYNQGTMLGAAVMLYNHYGDEQYKQDAERIMEYTVKHLCNQDGVINVCQEVDGDRSGFKGILMRYVRKFIIDLNKPEYVEWMQQNAMQAYSNMNSRGVIHSAWLTKSSEDFMFGDKKFDNQPFGCSTAVSVAFNAPLNGSRIVKDAFQPVRADEFNAIQGVYLKDSNSGKSPFEISNIRNDYYVGYNWIDFGSQPATSVSFYVSELGNATYQCAIEVHLDSIDGPCIGTAAIPNTPGWKTVTAPVAPTDGMHQVYLKFVNKENVAAVDNFRLAEMQFGTDREALPGDITDNGGQLKTDQQVYDLGSLTDNRLTTSATVPAFKGQAMFHYRSVAPALLKGYAIGSGTGDASFDAKSWTLQGSNDGQIWTTLDTQEAQAFAMRCQNKHFSVNTNKTFTDYRLLVTATNGGKALHIGEWQLLGTCLLSDDITADGGSMMLPEGSSLIDKNASTMASFDANQDAVIEYKAAGSYVLTSYSLTNGDSKATANPAGWVLYGSNDGRNWTELDRKRHETFPVEQSTQFYTVASQEPYKSFRLVITGNPGATHTALHEWQLIGKLMSSAPLYNDITKNGGKLTASNGANHADLQVLTDNNARTYAELPFKDEAWVQYQTPEPAKVTAYSICMGYDADKDPRTWQLQASNDGTNWRVLHQGSASNVKEKGTLRTFKMTNDDSYVYYRLLVKKAARASATSVVLGELQLHGLCVSNQDLTSQEGTTSCYVPGVNGGEAVDKLFDKAASSKYCFSFYGESWVDYQAAEGMKANLYSLTSGNDNPDRDPQSWKVLGSHDGSHWVVLDERTHELFYDRHTTQFYSFDNSEPYAYYRLQLDENKGSELCQISEFQLFYSDVVATGVNAIEMPHLAVKVYPNPVIDYLHVDLPTDGRIEVFDSQGLLMSQQRAQKGNNQVDFAGVAPGLYLVKVVCGAQTETFKVVK